MSLKVRDFIFCDDIRAEVRNKFSVMGMYADRVRVQLKTEEVKDLKLPLSILARFERTDQDIKDYTFRLEILFEKQSMAVIEGNFSFGEGSTIATIPFTKLEFQFENSGSLTFNVVVKANEIEKLKYSDSIFVEITKLKNETENKTVN